MYKNLQLATKNARLKLAVKRNFEQKSHTPCEETGSNDTREIQRQARDVAMRAIKKLGFTLVELAITLVIVGLLIGGILAGQSLIDSAKINSQIQQL
jgi:prepilin-type N-terminal cleavage/methylation domain-containing protein